MSRLYLLLAEYAKDNALSVESLQLFLKNMLSSHQDISSRSTVEFDFQYLINQPALKSQFNGWKGYSSKIKALYTENTFTTEMEVVVPYSSTCPCSAALARQKVQQRFTADFSGKTSILAEDVEAWLRSEQGTYATPHSQRSHATVIVKLSSEENIYNFDYLIQLIEQTLKTPVQTAVKREDEQAFAELNGQNLMFCEDAARRLKAALDLETRYIDFSLKVEHFESLHAHDAISLAVKGVPGGYQDEFYV